MKLFYWIGRALSEKGVPSSKRLIMFMFALTACYAIIYAVHRLHNLPTYIYYPLLCVILLLAGVATVPQLMEIWRGKSGSTEQSKPTNNEESI